jgi:hypothetical protein
MVNELKRRMSLATNHHEICGVLLNSATNHHEICEVLLNSAETEQEVA